MEVLALAVALVAIYVAYLKLQLHLQRREFAEFRKSVVIVPLPRRKQSPWVALFALSTLLLALAVLLLAVR